MKVIAVKNALHIGWITKYTTLKYKIEYYASIHYDTIIAKINIT